MNVTSCQTRLLQEELSRCDEKIICFIVYVVNLVN